MLDLSDFCENVEQTTAAKLLVVDDKPENHRAIAKVLTDIDVEVYNAMSGHDALALTLHHHFAVVLLDVMMPVMDGFETAFNMRVNEQTKNTPIIFITAADPNDEIEFKGYELGAVDYLFKPIKPYTLASKIKVFIELDQQRRKVQHSLANVQRLENRNKLLLDSIGEGIIGLDTNGHIIFTNPAADSQLTNERDGLLRKHILDVVFIADSEHNIIKWHDTPLFLSCSEGESFHEPVGVYWNRDGQLFPVEYTATPIMEQGQFIGIVIAFKDITERQRTEQQLARLAQYDSLTGLSNRYSISKALRQAIARADRGHNQLALLFIDLDQFKMVNDSLGHDIGDCLLQEVAKRLNRCVRDGDVVGRLGGDEFTVLMESYNDHVSQSAATVAEKVLATLGKVFHIRGNEIYIGASIGIVVYDDSQTSAETLMRSADIAMYRAKELGRNNYQFFTESLQQQAREAMALERQLRRAVANQAFELYFQPKIDVVSGQLHGVEALLRWQDEQGRFIAPELFVAKLEELGLDDKVGEWLIDKACQQLARCLQVSLRDDFTLAINLSGRQLMDEQLPDVLARAMARHGIDSKNLEVEVTEMMMMDDPERAVARIEAIHQLGVAVVVDDFGTGFSSLNYLRYLPLAALKIDQTFISHIGSSDSAEKIIRAIIALAHSLNLRVIAEGVEKQRQWDFLTAVSCDLIQGFIIAPAMPLDRILALLTSENS